MANRSRDTGNRGVQGADRAASSCAPSFEEEGRHFFSPNTAVLGGGCHRKPFILCLGNHDDYHFVFSRYQCVYEPAHLSRYDSDRCREGCC